MELLEEIEGLALVPDQVVYGRAVQILEMNCLWSDALRLLARWRHGGGNKAVFGARKPR